MVDSRGHRAFSDGAGPGQRGAQEEEADGPAKAVVSVSNTEYGDFSRGAQTT